MKCNETKQLLNALIDGELNQDKALKVAQHMSSCVDCHKEHQMLTELATSINSGKINYQPPKELKRRLSVKLKAQNNSVKSAPLLRFPDKLVYAFPLLVLGFIIGLSSMSYYHSRAQNNQLIQALTAAHINALMVDHLTDVKSSDSHTVKPWFHGRLDFSPPVPDLTEQDFPLLGGRLDYLLGKTTAALVYRHRQHTINLFIQPKFVNGMDDNVTSHNGYNIVHWNNKSLSFWAVSDLNMKDLNQFTQMFIEKY